MREWIVRAIGEFNRGHEMERFFDPSGKDVLDYGCGKGDLSFRLLERGAAHVTGIDISEAELAEARREASRRGVSGRVTFEVRDAHSTGFADGSFDVVTGGSVLHHLDLDPALREIHRILRPGGRAVFAEPLAHNPVLRLGRALTPSARTPDEHPLTDQDWELCASIFPGFQHHERELLSILLMPLNLALPRSWQRSLAPRVFALDDRLMQRWPGLRKHARVTILVLA